MTRRATSAAIERAVAAALAGAAGQAVARIVVEIAGTRVEITPGMAAAAADQWGGRVMEEERA